MSAAEKPKPTATMVTEFYADRVEYTVTAPVGEAQRWRRVVFFGGAAVDRAGMAADPVFRGAAAAQQDAAWDVVAEAARQADYDRRVALVAAGGPLVALLGRTVTGLRRSPDCVYLCFDTPEGVVGVRAEAPCCSHTWFEHVAGVDALLGGAVADVASREMPAPPQRDRRDTNNCVVEAFGIAIATNRGLAVLEYRSASNGEYTGDCVADPDADARCTIAVTEDF